MLIIPGSVKSSFSSQRCHEELQSIGRGVRELCSAKMLIIPGSVKSSFSSQRFHEELQRNVPAAAVLGGEMLCEVKEWMVTARVERSSSSTNGSDRVGMGEEYPEGLLY